MANYTYTFLDYSEEPSVVRLGSPEPAAGGADYDQVVTTDSGLVEDTLTAISLCPVWKSSVVVDEEDNGKIGATNQFGQRESGLRIFYEDAVANKRHHFTIPGPDLSITDLCQPGTDKVLLDGCSEMINLVIALEGKCLSPAGNAITVTGARTVGRNS